MRFWDTSAIVPLLLTQSQSEAARDCLLEDADMLVWWGSSVEFVSAVCRLEREDRIDGGQTEEILSGLKRLEATWHEILPSRRLKALALRLLRVHRLRAADSLQLAAALTAADGEAETLQFVSYDALLNRAASREGLIVIPR